MELPIELRTAIDQSVEGQPAKQLAEAARGLSERYRTRRAGRLVHGDLQATAYAAYRMPATYAAVAGALDEAGARQPAFQPKTLLDVGGGPGTAAWAAVAVWPEIERATILDRDRAMIALGKRLAAASREAALRGARWLEADALAMPLPPAELVTEAYTLNELQPDQAETVVRRLWDATLHTLVLVEPGTPDGYHAVHEAAAVLPEANVIAPAPGDWNCLASEGDWLHFSARVPRTRLLRHIKQGELSYEDEKYAYVVLSRHPGLPIVARVIRHPQIRPGRIALVLCTWGGVLEIVVTRSNKPAYRLAKTLVWGSPISQLEAAQLGLDV